MNPYLRDQKERAAALLFADLHDRGLELGHDLEPGWHDTEPYTWVAQCRGCRAWLFYDPNEEGNGLVAESTCPGAPPVPAAERRQELAIEAAVASAGQEVRGLGVTIIREWNW